ncbi:MAG: hypothetical protein ACI303_04935 [Lepagella sp.]
MIPFEILEIGTVEDVEKVAKFFTWQLEMPFFAEEVYVTRNEDGLKTKRIARFLNENERRNKLVENNLYNKDDLRHLREIIKRCYWICEMNNISFCDILIYFTSKEY